MSIVVLYIVSFIVGCRRRTARRWHLLRTGLSAGAFLLTYTAAAQDVDTVQRLEEITISSQRAPSTLRTATPTQVVESEQLQRIGALQLSDAIKQMAGVTLKDYGGVGGVKTVSARGLGSQFSAVTIDGVPVDDSQNGQVDLGRYTLGNAAYVSMSQGQEQGSLLTARAYAAGNVLNMETAQPSFWPGERTKLKAGMEAGSFGMASPTLLWQQRWGKRLSTSLWGNYLYCRGDYPFLPYESAPEKIRREHSAVWMATVDGNLFYTLAEGNTLSAKVHWMSGEHELPGPLHLHSQAPSGQSSDERLAFAQAKWKVERERWRWQLLGKVRGSYDAFLDTTPGTFQHNDYRQREGYLSASASHDLTPWLELNAAADASLSHLLGRQQTLTTPWQPQTDVTRRNLAAAAAARAHFAVGKTKLDLRANLVLTDIADRLENGSQQPHYQRLTPYLSAMATLGGGTTLRLFYKESYRAPNFGELYFFQLMAKNLRPEHARQLNLGATQAFYGQKRGLSGEVTVDVYYNRVSDKLVAYPLHSMYYWTTDNLGRVDITGLDATASIRYEAFSLQLNYTFQHAVDRSDEASKFYGHQIAYTPRHSGGGSARWESRWVNLGLTAMVVGKRYSNQQNIEKWSLPAYCDLGLAADRKFDLPVGTLGVRAQVMNLLGVQYEVVRSYPMMGRNWRLGMTYEF